MIKPDREPDFKAAANYWFDEMVCFNYRDEGSKIWASNYYMYRIDVDGMQVCLVHIVFKAYCEYMMEKILLREEEEHEDIGTR